LGKINFVRRFLLDYATIVKPTNLLLKKDHKFEWMQEIQRVFTKITHAITLAPFLVSPNFEQYFIIYYFASEETIASILTELNLKGKEIPISLMSKNLHDYELRYS
jgi:hypothetical protein